MPSCLCQIENTLVGGRVAMKQLLTYVLATVFFIFGTIAFLGAMAFTDPADPLPESVYDAYGAGQEKGDSTSLQRGCSRNSIREESIHALSSPREMIARQKMSQNEWKTIEI